MVSVSLLMVLIGAIIAIGFFSNLFFQETQIPDVIWLLLVGILIGPVLGLLPQQTLLSVSPFFAAIAVLIILFDSGLKMNLRDLLSTALDATTLTVTSFFIAMAFVAIPAWGLFGFSLLNSVLLGAILAGISSATVLTVLEEVRGMGKEARNLLEIESILSDPLTIVIAILLMEAQTGGAPLTFSFFTSAIIGNFSVSILLGIVIGALWSRTLDRIREYKYHHMLTLALLFLAYPLSEFLGGSGAIISLTIGIVLGNFRSFQRFFTDDTKLVGLTSETKDFNSLLTFFMRTFFFVFLGALVSLNNLAALWLGTVFTLFLLLARGLTVKIISYTIDVREKDEIMMTFTYPKGLAAAVVATLPFVEYNIPGTEGFPAIVFTVILASSVLATAGLASADKIYELGEAMSDEEDAG